ncbi:hypothetical protein [Lentzea albida]|uniref:Uncharacterized protein n=1 Tax=Lentzea albida TaxID=65499 RepID=A0A1H9AKQ0_9PSEU|nr:hypothetical protein [Lentzea albida]SEP77334.1 hypothetical protein SAMN04488000_101200 [Lentzea albida]
MSLTHTGNEFINVRDGSYQWVWLDHYRLAAVDDQDALAAMIDHELFGDNHAGGDPGDDPTRHGPYWRDRVRTADYEPVPAEAAESVLRTWAVTPPAEVLDDLHATYRRLHAAERVYRLRDLGTEAQHDWGWVLDSFEEFVLIGPGTLTVVIAGSD